VSQSDGFIHIECIADITNKKLSYCKQIARKQHTHSSNSKFSGGEVITGKEAYGTPVRAAAAVSVNFSVAKIFTRDSNSRGRNIRDIVGGVF